ncbi:MAG: hypothetical protein GX773_02820 [Chloroflexi bacterium]|nr:hypothetical protein [Chloroflexota bacterium]
MTENEIKRIVNKLMDKDVLSYRLREDGFLVVVNKQGWKVTFSPSEVEKAHQSSQRKARAANG